MRHLVHLASAMALAVAPLAPALAQPVDTMARPVPLPAPVPGRPPGNRPPDGGNWNNGNNNWNNDGGNRGGNWNGDIIRCESQNYRYRECRADTRGGVRLVRVRGGNCSQGRNWGWSDRFIWVDNGCRGDFQTRYGNGGNTGGNNNGGGGPSAAAIIGGVAVAGGLIALLAQSGKNKPAPTTGNAAGTTPTAPPATVPPPASTGPARISAEMGGVTPDARPSLNTCLNEAARQIGATGGTEIRLDRLDDIEAGNGGFRFRFQLKATYPDETRTIATFCRATPTRVIELTFG